MLCGLTMFGIIFPLFYQPCNEKNKIYIVELSLTFMFSMKNSLNIIFALSVLGRRSVQRLWNQTFQKNGMTQKDGGRISQIIISFQKVCYSVLVILSSWSGCLTSSFKTTFYVCTINRWNEMKIHVKFEKTGNNNWSIGKLKKGRNLLSERVSIPCWHAIPISNETYKHVISLDYKNHFHNYTYPYLSGNLGLSRKLPIYK